MSIKRLKDKLDIRDFLVFGGLILMGYGLYLYSPWVSLSVAGAILLCIGLFFGKRE